MKLTAIIVAAGSSQRMGFDKLLTPLAGKPVLEHSIEAFAICDDVEKIIIVCPQARLDQINIEFSTKPIQCTSGGADRHDSVASGLACLSGDFSSSKETYVAVHDGARPLISPAQISRVFHAAQKHHCAASASPVTDTIKRADDDGVVTQSVSRENLWMMQTPQIFRSDLLMQAYQAVQTEGKRVTDEVSALQLIGYPTHLIDNPEPNLKITYPQDIVLAEQLLARN